MSEMTNRVGEAIRDVPIQEETHWPAYGEAAIRAMREPTAAMEIAGQQYVVDANAADEPTNVAGIWQAMIEAALR